MKKIQKVQVKNQQGLHTRPATAIVKMLQKTKSTVYFTHKKERVNAKSILSLLMLAASKNAKITIEIEGEDAEATMEKLLLAFETEFD